MRGQTLAAVRVIAGGRVIVGVALCAAPDLAAPWAGDDARAPGAHMIIRAMGARDAALGLGTLTSVRDRAALRRWLLTSSACDAVDFAATLAGPRSRGRTAVLAAAAVAMLTGLAAARE